MLKQILEGIMEYGLETVMLALLVNFLTWIIKTPIKKLAKKMEDSTRVTRFIVFLPIALSFAATAGWAALIQGQLDFNRVFVTQWLSCGSLSLSFYAVYEKLFPSSKATALAKEAEAGQKLIKDVKQLTEVILNTQSVETGETDISASKKEKIVLQGNLKENNNP